MNNDKFIPSDKHIFTQKMLKKIDIGVIYTSMVANRDSIFVFGGDDGGFFTPSAEVRRYDFSDQKWHKMKEMPHYLSATTTQIIDGEIFIMGRKYESASESYNLVYNIEGNYWVERVKLKMSKAGLVSGVIDDIIYVLRPNIGWRSDNISSYLYAYNPKTNTWKTCHEALHPRLFGMSVVIDGYLYVLGGYTYDGKEADCTKMDRYCPKTDSGEEMPDMLRPRKYSVAVAIDSKIFVLCGSSDNKEYITMDYYDTRTKKWTISDIPTPQLQSPGVAVIDNKIYLTGGVNKLGEYNRNLYEITYEGMRE